MPAALARQKPPSRARSIRAANCLRGAGAIKKQRPETPLIFRLGGRPWSLSSKHPGLDDAFSAVCYSATIMFTIAWTAESSSAVVQMILRTGISDWKESGNRGGLRQQQQYPGGGCQGRDVAKMAEVRPKRRGGRRTAVTMEPAEYRHNLFSHQTKHSLGDRVIAQAQDILS